MDYSGKHSMGFKIKILKMVRHISKEMQVIQCQHCDEHFLSNLSYFSFFLSLVSTSHFKKYFTALITLP